MDENCFWAKTKEDQLERSEVLGELSKIFAAKALAKPKMDSQDGGPDKAHARKKKGKELKVLDAKSAQNLCKFNLVKLTWRKLT